MTGKMAMIASRSYRYSGACAQSSVAIVTRQRLGARRRPVGAHSNQCRRIAQIIVSKKASGGDACGRFSKAGGGGGGSGSGAHQRVFIGGEGVLL